MNRLKLFLLLLIIAVSAIIFVQNREPVALKLLCDDINSQYCLYQTPKLPVAIWIALFVVGGIFTNLLGQVFSRYSYSGASKKRYAQNDLYPESQNWVDRDSKQTRYSTSSAKPDDSVILERSSTSTSYEAAQKPESVERSGSNYSYKYHTQDKTKNDKNNAESTSIDLNKDTHLDSERDDEDWI